MLTQECVWFNNVKSLFPEPGTAGEKNEDVTVMVGKPRSFLLTVEEEQLLAKQCIFYHEIRTAAGQV
jgi:hypothetical protein